MPNGYDHKKFGPHEYADHDGTSDCEHGCGCWMGPARSGGPLGVDPFGICPNNPLDGKRREGKTDYEDVVTQRIDGLTAENGHLKNEINRLTKMLTPTIKQMQKRIDKLEAAVQKHKERESKVRQVFSNL
jgi:hypothetical protein